MLVVSDSGQKGAALAWVIPEGPDRALSLPLDPTASDDLEGIAWARGRLYTLTSSGAVRRFAPDGAGGLRRDQDAYAIGPAPLSCASLTDGNCGKNYEGLCLRPRTTPARCAGYAASKKEGALYCVVFEGDRLAIDALKPPLRLALDSIRRGEGALSDCAFGAEGGPAAGVLLVTTNVFGGSTTYVVDEAAGTLAPLDVLGTPSNEAVAIDRDGALYQFMDDNGATSQALRMSCTGW
jgi:hypothetical protein